MLSVVMLNVIMLNVIMLNVVMLNVVLLNVIMLNVVMLNVVMLSVVAPILWWMFTKILLNDFQRQRFIPVPMSTTRCHVIKTFFRRHRRSGKIS